MGTGEQRGGDELIADLARLRGRPCASCAGSVAPHDVLMAIVLGFKNAPRCLPCLASGLNEPVSQLRDALITYIRQRRCFAEAWNWASREIGADETDLLPMDFPQIDDNPIPHADEAWDAGDAGCGELALELRMRIEKLKAGAVFQLTTRDLGAPADVPAWCNLTGHTLLHTAPPSYWIKRKTTFVKS